MADWWANKKTWRFIQTNLREIDMVDILAKQVVADLQAFQANVLMINAAGIIASYPTKLPYHFQSPYLKGDSLKRSQSRRRVLGRDEDAPVEAEPGVPPRQHLCHDAGLDLFLGEK